MKSVVWEGQSLLVLGNASGDYSAGAFAGSLSYRPVLVARLEGVGEPFGRIIAFFEEVDSTNDLAFESAAGEGAVFLADSQKKGQGRENRRWESPSGTGLYFSAVAVAGVAENWGGLLMQSIAVSVAEAIRRRTSLEAGVKWPNDVMINGRKVSGVMARVNTGRGKRVCVIGVGVNVNQSEDELPSGVNASSLALEIGENVQKGPLLADILRGMNKMYSMLLTGTRSQVAELCSSFSSSIGARIVVDAHDGGKLIGKAIMIGESGELIVETDNGEVHSIVDPLSVVEQRIES
jgi:BirA family biotin operon repressor/biotin-[acetyl-CoA-carboxylase] ligase